MTILCAAATALLTAGLLIDGWPGTTLLALALAANVAWLTVTAVRWWQRAPYQHRRTAVTVTMVYLVAWGTIRATAGALAAWVLAFAALGLVAVVGVVAVVTGYLAAHHSKRAEAAIATIEANRRRKELTR